MLFLESYDWICILLNLNHSGLKVIIVVFHVGIHDYNFTFTEGEPKKSLTFCIYMEIHTRKLRVWVYFHAKNLRFFFVILKYKKDNESPQKNHCCKWITSTFHGLIIFCCISGKRDGAMRERWSDSSGAVKPCQVNKQTAFLKSSWVSQFYTSDNSRWIYNGF